MQGDHIVVHTAVSLLADIDIAHAYILIMRLLQTIEVERGVLTHVYLYHLSGKEVTVIGSMVAEKHLDLCTLLEYDEHPAVDHETG